MSQQCRVGDIDRIVDIVERLRPERVMLFTGGASYRASGAATTIEPLVTGRLVARIEDVKPNPTLASVEAAVDQYRTKEPDMVVAVGGGSVIDLAKSVRVISPQRATPRSIITGQDAITRAGPPLVAIPTTAGTGSETTHFFVVYVDGSKYSFAHRTVLPDFMILDPAMTYSVPPSVTAVTGLDALSQAMESLWSVRSTPESREFASRSLGLAVNALPIAVHHPDPASRAQMCEASHLAGRAIDVTTTTAPHAISYELTSRHDVPHGHAVALTLGAVLEYNAGVTDADCVDPRGIEHVRQIVSEIVNCLGASDASEARGLISSLVASLGLEPTLEGVGAGSLAARQGLVSSANMERLVGNPRGFTSQSLLDLILSIP